MSGDDEAARASAARDGEVPGWVLAGHPDPSVHRRARARLVGAVLDDEARSRLPVGLRPFLT